MDIAMDMAMGTMQSILLLSLSLLNQIYATFIFEIYIIIEMIGRGFLFVATRNCSNMVHTYTKYANFGYN